ncbi:putative lipid II flippase FtsW [bacterium]|jgi:cell division protein FtsW|nr:putative lipid II flippase FtsW [bacterium]MBT3904022.1 putative lipid II flippase FtsW [bacterium]MBT4577883.1 putative lipid II flippase FtsW [bacterium]MBT6130815.1 putative lipid II flippase FtsW [bacterium]MBT6528750.1 putative lipid II flippase FtsW [bacterium]
MKHAKQRQATYYKLTLLISSMLCIIGLIFIYSASSAFALERIGNAHFYVRKQSFGFLLGIIILGFTYCIPFGLIQALAPLIFVGALFLTGITLIPGIGRTVHGSSRWISLFLFNFQPGELLKIAFMLAVARLCAKTTPATFKLKKVLPPTLILLIPASLILLKQPDFGTFVMLVTITASFLFVAGMSTRRFVIASGIMLPILATLIALRPYRVKRILTFLDPWKNPQGAGFQIIQSLIAIASGGLYGQGIGFSKQKFFYLPMQHTDFIFSIITEESGLIGAMIIIISFVALIYLIMRIALLAQNRFAFFVALGSAIILGTQAAINIGVALGMLPTKGISLPFVSYGNSSLISTLLMIGLVGASIHAKPDQAT